MARTVIALPVIPVVLILLLAGIPPGAEAVLETVTTGITPGFNYYDSNSQPFGFLAAGSFRITLQNFVRVSTPPPSFPTGSRPSQELNLFHL